jgi:uncharacterized protein YndB with AHSA1/START domain
VRLAGRGPDEAFRDWTEPDRLRRWWPPEARLEARLGGTYEFAWPRQDWRLRGTYREFRPGRALAFTWTWDHEPAVTKRVRVDFRPADEGGTQVELEHGPYGAGARDGELRREHLEGWRHFLGRWVELPPA